MKAIRRSLKGDKDAKQPQHLSLPSKSAVAIIPPKKVIKALYDYEPQDKDGDELAFHKGDFFHVLSREDDTEWYEACNPLIPSARGLVPVAFFEVIGKQQRQSGQSQISDRTDHEPSLAEKGTTNSNHTRSDSSGTNRPAGHGRELSMGSKGGGAMVYGIVQYDFNAERADELDAKAGEAIIVVAQSNPEWFVAKPIGRLGGPGLIPVSFVDIKDTATMQSVPDPLEAVRKAGVPRVEEWKRFAAEYKNSSISLGKFDNNPQAQLAGDMSRMSLQQQQQQNRGPSQNGAHPQQTAGRQTDSQEIPLAPVSASVPRYCFDNDMYWYIIECQMEDGRWFELSRYYADFYDFQIALLESFPDEAGNRGKPRMLPFMPGPVAHVTDAISNGRRQNLDEYIKKIVAMPPHISKSMLVRNLFNPKPGQDFEIDPNALEEDYRLSGGSQSSVSRVDSNQHSSQNTYGENSSTYGRIPSEHSASHQRAQQSVSASTGVSGPNSAQPYAKQQPHHASQPSASSGVKGGAVGGAMKVKVFFQDDIIAIRVPQDISFQALKNKLTERLKVNEDIVMQYKDDASNSFIDMDNDDHLDVALQRNPKLTLSVSYASG